MKFLSSIIFAVLLLAGCSTSQPAAVDNASIRSIDGVENPTPFINLSEHLKNVPGITVLGSGLNATIRIRGINSINLSNEPLFVVDGQQVNGGYTAVAQLISVNDIKSIRVLKDANDMAFYGVLGANGVIEIRLKD